MANARARPRAARNRRRKNGGAVPASRKEGAGPHCPRGSSHSGEIPRWAKVETLSLAELPDSLLKLLGERLKLEMKIEAYSK